MPTPTTTAATGRLVEAATADSLALAEAEAERLAEAERAAAAAREANPPPPPDPTPRKRRAYDVWVERTLAELLEIATATGAPHEDVRAWVRLDTAVDKPSRDGALNEVRQGRNGRFATILDGEFVEHVINDPDAALAERIARDLVARGDVGDLDGLRAVIAASIADAQEV
jgi:hypothetical protein